jgi:hypothetical protein
VRASAGINIGAGELHYLFDGRMRCVMISHQKWTLVLFSALAMLCSATGVNADRFDGSWNMLVKTTHGHCGYVAVGLGIKSGRIYSTSGSFAFYPIKLGGRVSASGRAQIKAVAGPRTAKGTGRFGKYQASGTWAGRGPSGICSGVWSANRS